MISKNQVQLYCQKKGIEPDSLNLEPYHKPNIYTDFESEEEYHGFFGLSQSSLKSMEASAYKFYYETFLSKGKKASYAMDLGTYLHSCILEPHRLEEFCHDSDVIDEILAESPDTKSPRSKKEYKEWVKQKKDAGKIIIQKEDIENTEQMIERVYGHKEAATMLSNGLKEKAILLHHEHWDLYLRGKLDCFSVDEGWVLDVKKCQNVSPEEFSKTVFNYRYFIQAYFYKELFEKKFQRPLKKYYWLACESNAPFDCRLYYADSAMMEAGEFLVNYYISELQECLKNNNFDNLPKKAQELSLPYYADSFLDRLISNKMHMKG